MPMDAHDIESMIKAAIPDAEVTIRDLAGDGDHYAATVISASFKGKSRVQQHQLVYEALKGQMGGVLHALALQTGTPWSIAGAATGHLEHGPCDEVAGIRTKPCHQMPAFFRSAETLHRAVTNHRFD